MCDYSLMALPNRLAVRGEELLVHRFEVGSVGLAPACEIRTQTGWTQSSNRSFWSKLKAWFVAPVPSQCTAVCIPPGAQLLVRDFPLPLQRLLSLESATQKVTFTQVGTAGYRDAIRFSNGAELLLQRLAEGQRVRVLALSPQDGGEEYRDLWTETFSFFDANR